VRCGRIPGNRLVKVLAVRTKEEREIAEQTAAALLGAREGAVNREA
jgi:hypothetical protein